MKQHITKSQLNELSDKGKDRLKEWFVRDFKWQGQAFVVPTRDVDFVSSINIGQLIEFLEESREYRNEFSIIRASYENDWIVGKRQEGGEVAGLLAEELCDALWEAVKEVLNE